MEGKPDILIEVIDSFLKTSPKRIEDIFNFIAQKNVYGAAKEAHALKSGSQTLGALELSEICQKIENIKQTNNLNELEKSKELLEIKYKNVCDEFREIKLKHIKNSPQHSPS